VISREMIQATSGKLRELCERDLSGLDIRVIVIDGFVLAKQMVVAVLGVESSGKKHILGFREGATENARVCIDLLQDLQARKLRIDRPILVIIDGSRALRAAVDQFFGSNAIVQRCQQHKRENLKKYLPEDHQAAYDRKLQAIYGMTSYDDAKRSLTALIQDVGRISISAANSLEEGFEETLTVHRLGLPDVLRHSFSTTNLIESAFSVARTVMHNIKRWRTPMQRSRWISTALLQAEKQFRCVRGFKSMSVLVAALDAYEPQRNNTMTAA
jgi:transposase-like protein